MTALLVLTGGAVGAALRYLADRWVARRLGDRFPAGILVVNVVGSLLLGVLLGSDPPAWALVLGGTGFCGALTTFSTFSYDTVRLVESSRWTAAALNVLGSVSLGLAGFALGFALGSALAQA